MDEIDRFLNEWPDEIASICQRLRRRVRESLPYAQERLRTGWKLVGYETSATREGRYFAYVAPQKGRAVLGFEYGIHLGDPAGILRGSGTQVRQIEVVPGDWPADEILADYILRAAALADQWGRLPKTRRR